MISMEDYRRTDGQIDWQAYKKAKVENGDDCRLCGHYILFGSKGYPQLCTDCDKLRSYDGEVYDNKSGIRCPGCRKVITDPYEMDCDMFQEGTHETTCRCGCTFEFETTVTYSWTSPSILKDDREEDEDDVDSDLPSDEE